QEIVMFEYCKYKGLGILAFAPLVPGVLARPSNSPESLHLKSFSNMALEKKLRDFDKAIILRVEEITKKHGWKMANVALAWNITRVSSSIVGANSAEKVQAAVFIGKTLSDEEVLFLSVLTE
ncbi:hypothetical protein C8J56DRAFT_789103, partial [Mycena floridula]